MYAKKNKIRLVNVGDSDNPNEKIVTESDGLLIFLDEKKKNKIAWDIIRKAKALNKVFYGVKTIPQPPLEGTEKEIMEILAKLDDLGWESEGKDIYNYFKRHKRYFKTFANYVEKGKQMDKNNILYKLSELCLTGCYFAPSKKCMDIAPECEIAGSCIFGVFAHLSSNTDECIQKKENYAEILHDINPEFPIDIDSYELGKEELFMSIVENIQYCFPTIIPYYEERDEEMCNALCVGLWWVFNTPADLQLLLQPQYIVEFWRELNSLVPTLSVPL
jgi:hypothetical protein